MLTGMSNSSRSQSLISSKYACGLPFKKLAKVAPVDVSKHTLTYLRVVDSTSNAIKHCLEGHRSQVVAVEVNRAALRNSYNSK
jgi:hypothetical protein